MRWLFVTLGVLALAGVTVVVVGALRPTAKPMRLGINPWPGYQALELANARGYFADCGLAVEFIEYASLSDIASGYANGDIDAMTATLNEVVIVRNRSRRKPQVVHVCDVSHGADQVFAVEAIGDLAGLKGQRIGVDVASLGSYLLYRAVQRAGLQLSDVIIVPCDASEMAAKIVRGDIVAAISYPPYARDLRAAGCRPLFSSADIPGEVLDVIAIEARIVAKQPELVGKLQQVWDRIQADIAADPQRAYADMGRALGLSGDDFAKETQGITLLSSAESRAILQPGGTAERALVVTAEVLRHTGQVATVDLEGALVHER